jgi:lathosterol oxidase
VSFFRWPWLNYTDHHTLHHWYSDFNLGQYTTFWDRFVGTYRSPKVDYEYRPKSVAPTSTAPTALGGRSANPA